MISQRRIAAFYPPGTPWGSPDPSRPTGAPPWGSPDPSGHAWPAPALAHARLGHGPELAAQVADLVADAGGVLEAELLGRLVHLLLQGGDQALQVGPGHAADGRLAATAARPAPGGGGGAALAAPAADGRALLLAPEGLDDVGDPLAHRLGVDAVGGVPVDLELAAAVGLLDGPPHRRGDLVGVHDHLAVDVAGGPADGLDQGGLRAQEALLVGVQDGHQGHLGQVEALAQQV